jgi:hypothetical protein
MFDMSVGLRALLQAARSGRSGLLESDVAGKAGGCLCLLFASLLAHPLQRLPSSHGCCCLLLLLLLLPDTCHEVQQ